MEPSSEDGPPYLDDLPAPLPGRVAASVAAAVVGLAITPATGPVGGVLAAAALQPIFERVVEFDRRGRMNVESVLDQATSLAGVSATEAAEWAGESDSRLQLLASTVGAAWGTLHEPKIQALARVLAAGFTDDAQLDVSILVVAALERMEAPHIQVLHSMIHERNPEDALVGITTLDDDPPPPRPSQVGEWSVGHLCQRHRNLADGMASIVATLDRAGCIAPGAPRLAGPRPDEFPPGAPWTWWVATAFGVTCLRYLESASLDAVHDALRG